jgi:hypothetical protein
MHSDRAIGTGEQTPDGERLSPPQRPTLASTVLSLQRGAGNAQVARALTARRATQRATLARAHLTMDQSREAWKSQANTATPEPITEHGQFYVSSQLGGEVSRKIDSLAGAGVTPAAIAQLHLVQDALWSWDTSAEASAIAAAKTEIVTLSKPAAAAAKGVLEGWADAKQLYESAHNARRAGRAPNFTGLVTIGAFRAIHAYEADKCGATAGGIIEEVIGKGGFKGVDAGKTRTGSFPAQTLFKGLPIRNMTPRADGFVSGDAVQFVPLGGVVKSMQDALEAGFFLHCRVLSGIGSDSKQPPANHAEHSIVVIGFDGDEFIFWDPDSGASNRKGSGFGQLFVDPYWGRLSTARNDNEFYVDGSGNQNSGDHRYQVLSIFTK